MPLYDYRCDDCGLVHEQRHTWDDAPRACPGCGSLRVQKQLPTFAVVGRAATSRSTEAVMACTPTGCERPGCPSRLN